MRSQLHIQTALRGDITYLEKAYCTQPFKIADITEDKNDETLRLMLMSSSPGILDGDEYDWKINIGEDCTLQLQTQSFQRLFSMKKTASQTIEVRQGNGSSFCFLPHPVVPHEASSFSSKSKIFLSDGCSLVWGEVLTCGRKLNGEVFKFSKYHATTEIFINNKLAIKENLLINPSIINVKAIGQLEGYTHQATFIFLKEKVHVNDFIKNISNYLSTENEIVFGISAAPVNGFIVRLLGCKAEQLYACLKLIAEKIPVSANKKIEYAG
ncbi:MAG: urease accessory protein UreD [Chitinophagaceae bacterium]|nr:urease accessory protein UreD [Chitinophagaceae bacterium]